MEKLYTIKETMEILKVSRISIYNWINDGTINAVKLVGTYRIKESEIKRIQNEGV